MKFKNLETDTIIEITDKEKIKKFQGYPDKFEAIIELKEPKLKQENK